jgi:NADH pyrophosphatase NudC (nudix superfamily)
VNKNNEKQVMEIGDIGWFTLDECLSNIRDYSVEKKDVISNLSFILTYFIINLKNKVDEQLRNTLP